MTYHVLNGDSLAFTFKDAGIKGEVIVTREALIDGSLAGNTLDEFWKTRAGQIGITENEYQDGVVKEFEKILNAPANTEFNLWFEYDLFCQSNMWFVLSLINSLTVEIKVYAVYSSYLERSDKNFWNGFGPATGNELVRCLENRILLTKEDIRFGNGLWEEYKNNNLKKLKLLSEKQNPAFPYIREVIQAHIDRFPAGGKKGRPEKTIENIIKNSPADFNTVFTEFWKKESIYGFGDLQLKKIYDKVLAG